MSMLQIEMFLRAHDLLTAEEGQDLVEYALLVSLIALACIASISQVGTAIATMYTNMSNSI